MGEASQHAQDVDVFQLELAGSLARCPSVDGSPKRSMQKLTTAEVAIRLSQKPSHSMESHTRT